MATFGGISRLWKMSWISRFGSAQYQDINNAAKTSDSLSTPLQGTGDSTAEEHPTTSNGRDWIKGVVVCAWTVGALLLINIILTAVAAGIAYRKNGTHGFVSASLYQGKCSVSKNWATGIHLVINILSTIMLGASNYCMQCLASPSRAEVDNAHRQRFWVSIGIPNIPDLLLHGKGRRRVLGFILLITSLPFHLIYNSAAYYSLGPSEYGVVLAQADSFDIPTPLHEADRTKCSNDARFNITLLADGVAQDKLKRLSKQECVDRFAQDYVSGQRMLFLMANTTMPENQPFLYVDYGNNPVHFGMKGVSTFTWMCDGLLACTKNDVQQRLSNWTFGSPTAMAPYLDLTVPTHDGLRSFNTTNYNVTLWGLPDTEDTRHLGEILAQRPYEGALEAALGDGSIWTNSSWTHEITIDGYGMNCENPSLTQIYEVDHCVSLPTDERCQLSFSPPICLIIICCSVIKLLCILLAARDDRDEVLLTVGDAIASFLTRPDPSTQGTGLLSKVLVQDKNSGWYRNYNEGGDIPLLSMKEYNPQRLPENKRWSDAVSRMRWMSTLILCVILIAVGCLLLGIGIKGFREFYKAENMWDFGLGEVTAATLVTVIKTTKTGIHVLGMILLANTPQLVVSIAYFMHNAVMTCMLLAAEYDDYAAERKPVRVSWPRGAQRSTYYLSLPYRYSVPLLVTSAVLHWLISQSLFFVEINPFDQDGVIQEDRTQVTCGYSPVATLFAIIVGVLYVAAVLLLGRRRFRSRMPLAVHCSAAISAACHPITEGDHALQPVQWGEVAVDVVRVTNSRGLFGSGEYDGYSSVRDDQSQVSPDTGDAVGESRIFHCSFSSDKIREPHTSRLYI
ncbi:hypothetical protein BJX96DRAFT_171126 [Aspergillus floccosus]